MIRDFVKRHARTKGEQIGCLRRPYLQDLVNGQLFIKMHQFVMEFCANDP